MHRPPEENSPVEELPAELPAPEVAEIVTLPEPPVEVEASGSDQPEDLSQPTAAAEAVVEEVPAEEVLVEEVPVEEVPAEEVPAEEVPAEEVLAEEVPAEEAGSEDGELNSDNDSEVVMEEVEVALVEVENIAATPEEEQPNVEEIPEELEVSTAASETNEEEENEVEKEEVLPPEHVDVSSEASETDQLPAGHDSAEDNHEEPEDGDAKPPAEEPHSDAEGQPVAPVLEEATADETTEVIGQEVEEEVASEAPPVEEKVSEAPQISTEDLTEDEILLVNQDLPEPPATEYLSPAPPTALSPEKESPFTRIPDVSAAAATEGQPGIVITPLVEVTNTQDYFVK